MRVKIALFFTIIFSILLITPSVISLVDDTINISLFVNMNEEEEGDCSLKAVKVKITSENENSFLVLNKIQKKKNASFQSKNYISEYPKITTPPPKYLI